MKKAALLALLLAACQTVAEPEPPPPFDLPATIDAVTAQCREIGGTPATSIDGAAATVTCTRPDGVSETWSMSAPGG